MTPQRSTPDTLQQKLAAWLGEKNTPAVHSMSQEKKRQPSTSCHRKKIAASTTHVHKCQTPVHKCQMCQGRNVTIVNLSRVVELKKKLRKCKISVIDSGLVTTCTASSRLQTNHRNDWETFMFPFNKITLKLSAQPYGQPNAKYVHFCTCTRYLMCT